VQVHRGSQGPTDDAGHSRSEGEHLGALLGQEVGECGDMAPRDDEAVTVCDRMEVEEDERKRTFGDHMGGGAPLGDFAEGAGDSHRPTIGGPAPPGGEMRELASKLAWTSPAPNDHLCGFARQVSGAEGSGWAAGDNGEGVPMLDAVERTPFFVAFVQFDHLQSVEEFVHLFPGEVGAQVRGPGVIGAEEIDRQDPVWQQGVLDPVPHRGEACARDWADPVS